MKKLPVAIIGKTSLNIILVILKRFHARYIGSILRTLTEEQNSMPEYRDNLNQMTTIDSLCSNFPRPSLDCEAVQTRFKKIFNRRFYVCYRNFL